ncbi:intraflagellar transport protein 46 homolog isoform X2 [Cylas formicarius]|uniref:intraflagellar transport protein 46 homolog isoform X2 n=1 Tax=Cylas formicarius TaxID=197179 RepID=UPI0029589D3F|nr:intraflagellar transport protein 46 homolog isoform X2 [Cylas formicarius]
MSSGENIIQRSFSIIDQDDDDESAGPKGPEQYALKTGHESDDWSQKSTRKPEALPRQRVPSAGPSKKTALPKGRKSLNSSDSEESEDGSVRKTLPGQYDPKMYDDLIVDDDVRAVFQYIVKYTPQHLNIEYKFKPFVPEFLPAVGDIDAFLKIIPPETTLSGDVYDENGLQLGLLVLDEPAANQSDPALLQLQLRAAADADVLTVSDNNEDVVVKKIDNTEKNSKVIEKWIKDISHLHRSKSSPIVRYSQPMPDLDDLMQEWPEDVEKRLKEVGFPKPRADMLLGEYVDTVCGYFDIPDHNRCLLFLVNRQEMQSTL